MRSSATTNQKNSSFLSDKPTGDGILPYRMTDTVWLIHGKSLLTPDSLRGGQGDFSPIVANCSFKNGWDFGLRIEKKWA